MAWSADGRILDFSGDVRVNGKPVTRTIELHQSDTIVTAPGASVRIVLADNSVLDLESGARIRLSDFNFNPRAPQENRSDISIIEGTLRYVSGLIAKENPDNIGFTAGDSTIGVRGSFTGIAVAGSQASVEARIGTATVTRKNDTGNPSTVAVPPGQAARTDPGDGKTVVAPSTTPDRINDVVRAIAAAAPDAAARAPTDEGCSRGSYPVRTAANPEVDAKTSTDIDTQLAALTRGELIMVMAVLINNAGHLCIDESTVARTLARIAALRPDAIKAALAVSVLLNPENTQTFTEAATPVPPAGRANRPQADEPPINNEVPPGGNPPSPE